MTVSEPSFSTFRRLSGQLRPHVTLVLLAAGLFASMAVLVSDRMTQVTLGLIAFGLLVSGAAILGGALLDHLGRRRLLRAIEMVTAQDFAVCIVTGVDGEIQFRNAAAEREFPALMTGTLSQVLHDSVANPGTLLFRLEGRADRVGAAHEDVLTRRGHIRISVHRADARLYLWRIEKAADMVPRRADPMPLPMITVGRNDAVLFMNQAARDLIGERARTLDRICPRLPIRSGLINDVATRDGVYGCLAVELDGVAGRREIFLIPGIAATERQPDGWAFFDELPVPLLKLSADGKVQLSNRPARDLLGVELCNDRPLGEMLEGLGRPIRDWLSDAAAGRGTVHSEFLRVRRDDTETFVQVTLNRAREDGETILIAVMNDATELKSLEAQFVQSQKMQAIGQLASGVAHDFNNLLTAISGHCDLLLLRHGEHDGDFNDLQQINQNANRAASLVNQLLAYSRKQTLTPEIMDLRDTLSDLTHLLNRLVGERVDLSLSHDPELWSIRADRRQFEQVLMNLVVNARDAMADGGEVRVRTENIVLDTPLIRDRATVAPGRYVKVSVEDEGNGIPPDKLRKVFEPFFTTKRVGEGTGLGLSTVYGIIKQTGAFIFVDSEPGRGACFFMLFAAFDRAPEPRLTPSPTLELGAPIEGSVLLVEDEAPVRAFASRAMQLRGLTVMEAESAEEALEILSDDMVVVDVFVTDVVMPGQDGPGWVRHALQARPDVHTVFMSGYAQEDFSDARANIPNTMFLSKPFSLSELTEAVHKQLKQKNGAGPAEDDGLVAPTDQPTEPISGGV